MVLCGTQRDRVAKPMAAWRPGPVGQPLHHAPARFVRSNLAPDTVPHPNQERTERTGVKISAPRVVLSLLCILYLILFVNRVNIATAAPLIKAELGLTN